MAKKLIVGNWKMYPTTKKEALAVYSGVNSAAKKYKNIKVVVCPPYVFSCEISSRAKKSNIEVGAQDAFWELEGAFTGEVSPQMIKNIGAKYVIIGHSERRKLGEANEIVQKKIRASLKTGLNVILCVGERERDSEGYFFSFVEEQLTNGLKSFRRKFIKKLTIAYEPIWAIGKNALRPASPEDLHEMTIFIRKVLVKIIGKKNAFSVPILYGGSVDDVNAASFIGPDGADGLLVGRASLDIKKFAGILDAANKK